MARETRASGNAAAAAAAAGGSANGAEGNGGSALTKETAASSSTSDASPSRKRKRGAAGSGTGESSTDLPQVNGTTSTATAELGDAAASPTAAPASGPTVLGKRLKVVLKTRKPSGSAPAESAEVLADKADAADASAAEHIEDAVMADGLPNAPAEGGSATGETEVALEDKGKKDGAGEEGRKQPALSARLKEGLLSVMLAMEQTLLPGLAQQTHLVDLPLTLSRPAPPKAAEAAAERPNKKGKKVKGKSKLVGEADKADAGASQMEGVWSMRRALSDGGLNLTVGDLEAHLFELAGLCVPAAQNPFHPYPSSLAGPSSRSAPTALSEYFAALHGVAAQIRAEATAAGKSPLDVKPVVRFALQQRLPVPGFGTVGREGVNQGMQDWFSGLITMPEIIPVGKEESGADVATASKDVAMPLQAQEHVKAADVEDDDGVVTRLLLDRKMGHAQPVLVAPTDTSNLHKLAVPQNKLHMNPEAYLASYGPPSRRGHVDPPISLGQSILKEASRKVSAWRNRKERGRPMGWTGKPVKFPSYEQTFTPSFAPTLDSSDTTGGWGYGQTLDALEVHAAKRAWLDSAWGPHVGTDWEEELPELGSERSAEAVKDVARHVLQETLGEKIGNNIDPSLIQAVAESSAAGMQSKLDENARLVQELMAWQDIRIRRGQAEVTDERERETAARLARNLADLVSCTTPNKLLPNPRDSKIPSRPPLAVMLAEKIISTAGPRLRGTLDPQRSRALIDNATVRLKTNAVALARPPPPPLPAAPRPPANVGWGRPAIPAYGRPPMPAQGYSGSPAPKFAPPPVTPQAYRPTTSAYGSPIAYPNQRPAMYTPSPSGLSPYPSPGTQHPPRGRPPSAARGVGAGMGLSIQNMMPGTPSYPAQRPSGLRGQLG